MMSDPVALLTPAAVAGGERKQFGKCEADVLKCLASSEESGADRELFNELSVSFLSLMAPVMPSPMQTTSAAPTQNAPPETIAPLRPEEKAVRQNAEMTEAESVIRFGEVRGKNPLFAFAVTTETHHLSPVWRPVSQQILGPAMNVLQHWSDAEKIVGSDSAVQPFKEPVKVIRIQLKPESLGVVDVRLAFEEGRLSVVIGADRREAIQALTNDQGHLVRALEAQGYSVDRLSFAVELTGRDSPVHQESRFTPTAESVFGNVLPESREFPERRRKQTDYGKDGKRLEAAKVGYDHSVARRFVLL